MKKLSILATVYLLISSCQTDNVPDYHGVWLNRNLDYLELSIDSLAIATVYDNYLHREKYITDNDTLISKGKIIFCKNFTPCTYKFLLVDKKIKPLKTQEVSEYFFDVEDAFLKENDRFSIEPFDSLVIQRFELTAHGTIRLAKIKIDNSGKIKWSTNNENLQKEYSFSSDIWGILNLELMKIDIGQFKLWNEGETADDNTLKINIFRNGKSVEFEGSIIPYYYKMLRRVIDSIEILRLEDRVSQ